MVRTRMVGRTPDLVPTQSRDSRAPRASRDAARNPVPSARRPGYADARPSARLAIACSIATPYVASNKPSTPPANLAGGPIALEASRTNRCPALSASDPTTLILAQTRPQTQHRKEETDAGSAQGQMACIADFSPAKRTVQLIRYGPNDRSTCWSFPPPAKARWPPVAVRQPH